MLIDFLHFVTVYFFKSVFLNINEKLGVRTFGVLTKLDLMDRGTNALDVSRYLPKFYL